MTGGHARYLAERIPHARLVELDGDDHAWFAGDSDRVLDEIESFLTGQRAARPTNRVLSTVLFTDIVNSTRRASEIGDRDWHALLDAHDAVVRSQLVRFRGREVSTSGDGFLAVFDGPRYRGALTPDAVYRALRTSRHPTDGSTAT